MGYSEGTVRYSGVTVRVQWGYNENTVKIQWGYSQDTGGYSQDTVRIKGWGV